ncbi:mechanosensitive ion channel [Acuticoccus sp. MNP-M23]|uniref:mechanosensitive ion channel domain-containing protein n=1 Tax=Acuticoccus sp. MNP-M23 TaxID=3072793 RepID=UPI002815C09A|nr:mechanosensitive ion channel domain-containing protein [Acuticoccus sp. MNP-M23]WMS42693.1 mechanosensitive ion channel [Acuticoccus sp. MNP-M23]
MALTMAVLATGALAPAHAQTPDLEALEAGVQASEQSVASLKDAVQRQVAENRRIADRLGTLSNDGPISTIEDLRQAQFEVDIARTRILNIDHRIETLNSKIAAISGSIVRQSVVLGNPSETLQYVVDAEALEITQRQRKASEAALSQLQALRAATLDSVNWHNEQLLIAQRAARLDVLISGATSSDAALLSKLRELVAELSQRAMTLDADADNILDASPNAVAERNAERVRADEVILRSNARQTDISIVTARAQVRGITPLIQEQAIPVRLFSESIDLLGVTSGDLARRIVVNETIREALRDLSQILQDTPDDQIKELSERIKRLRALLNEQDGEIKTIREEIGTLVERLARERSVRDRETLFQRRSARTDRQGRDRIMAEVLELPGEFAAIYRARLAEVRTAVTVALPRSIGIFFLATLALLGTIIWLRQRLLKRFISADATSATEIPLEVLRRNLFWLVPAVLWFTFTKLFAISSETASTITTLLLIPPAAASLQDLTAVIVNRRGTGAGGIGKLIRRATAVAMVLTTVVVVAYILLEEVPLLPSTQLAINRLAYSVFVLAGMPMLLFVIFFAQSGKDSGRSRVRSIIASLMALVPPSALIATGVAGLAGYTQLAAIMLEDLATAIAIGAGFALFLGIFYDLLDGMALRIRERDPARAYFVRQNFLGPAKVLGSVVLAAFTVVVAVNMFEWTTETIFIKEGLAAWRYQIFSISTTPYTLGSLVLLALALAFVFWAGAWSRRIAYSVFLGNLKDIGIRQSLSVFAQYVVIVIGVLLTLSAIGFDVTTLTVFAASLGVGIGFGLQNVVNNFISGLLLLVERPLRIGDIVTVGTTSGTVSQIGIRSMRMKTFDEFELIVPNSALVSDTFTNWTRSNSLMRVLLTVGISYDDAPEEAVALITKILDEHPGIVPSPAPLVTVDEFGDNSVNLRVCYYGDLRGEYSLFSVRGDVLTAIRNRFAAAGLSIPYPQRDIHMINAKPVNRPDPGEAEQPLVSPRRDADGWQGDAIEMVEDSGKD